MKLHQLRYLCEVIDNGLSVSRASTRLHTSPSGISKQLKILEDELGTELLTRRNTRITGVTRAGEAALPTIRRILHDVDHVRRVSRDTSARGGTLRIATTHTNACYALVRAIRTFVRRWPDVALHFRQGTPAQIGHWVASGTVDLGIGTTALITNNALQHVPCYQLTHSVVVPAGHALLRAKRLTLEAIAKYPLVSNGETSRLGRLVEDTFAASGVHCEIAIRAMDPTAMKRFVELGLGIAVLPSIAVDPAHDTGLRSIPAGHLFKPGTAFAITLKDRKLPDYGEAFIGIAQREGGARAGIRRKAHDVQGKREAAVR
ncbi:MAG: LysR substrate-binding domain-containing protein [Rhodospirillaceae bacterium]